MTDTFTIGTSKFATDLRLSPQCRKILAHLKQRKTISNMESMMVYHVYRLSDVIHKLRRAGYDIDTEERVDGVGGRYATYKLMGARR